MESRIMTIGYARRPVETARASDPAAVDPAELSEAMTMLRDRLGELYNETQRESARWRSATADRDYRSLLEVSLPLPLAEVLGLTPRVENDSTQTNDVAA